MDSEFECAPIAIMRSTKFSVNNVLEILREWNGGEGRKGLGELKADDRGGSSVVLLHVHAITLWLLLWVVHGLKLRLQLLLLLLHGGSYGEDASIEGDLIARGHALQVRGLILHGVDDVRRLRALSRRGIDRQRTLQQLAKMREELTNGCFGRAGSQTRHHERSAATRQRKGTKTTHNKIICEALVACKNKCLKNECIDSNPVARD